MKKLSIILIALLFLVGCTTSDTPETPDDNPPKESTPSDDHDNEKDDEKDQDGEYASLDSMWDLYTDSYEGVEVTEIEFKHKGSRAVYEFEGYLDEKEYEVTYDAKTKEVIEEDVDDSSKPKHVLSKKDLENIEAILKETAADVPDGFELDEWELEKESDMAEFEVEYENKEGDEIEFKYNANTKELIKKSD